MPWIFWWRKPRTRSEEDARLPDGKREQITLCIEASDSSTGTKSVRGIVLPPASAEERRERFFRHRRSASGQLLSLRATPEQSSELLAIDEFRSSSGKPLLLESDVRSFDSREERAAYFARCGYAVSEGQGLRLRAPAIALCAAKLRFAAGRATKTMLTAVAGCDRPEKTGTDE
jgi:hypothetical protein